MQRIPECLGDMMIEGIYVWNVMDSNESLTHETEICLASQAVCGFENLMDLVMIVLIYISHIQPVISKLSNKTVAR